MPLMIFKAKCSKCVKVVEGLSQSAVDYNLQVHIKAKHEAKKEKK